MKKDIKKYSKAKDTVNDILLSIRMKIHFKKKEIYFDKQRFIYHKGFNKQLP